MKVGVNESVGFAVEPLRGSVEVSPANCVHDCELAAGPEVGVTPRVAAWVRRVAVVPKGSSCLRSFLCCGNSATVILRSEVV